MTTQSKTMMAVQGLGFAVYWPITIDLSYSAHHPPMSVLVAASGLSLILGVAFIAANLVRDHCMEDPVTKSLYNSFQFFAVITSMIIISTASAASKMPLTPPAEWGGAFYEIVFMLVLIGISVLALAWSLFWWWRARRCSV